MGGLKFIPHRHKLLSEVHSSSWLRKGLIVEVKRIVGGRFFGIMIKRVKKSLFGSHRGLWHPSQTVWGWAHFR